MKDKKSWTSTELHLHALAEAGILPLKRSMRDAVTIGQGVYWLGADGLHYLAPEDLYKRPPWYRRLWSWMIRRRLHRS